MKSSMRHQTMAPRDEDYPAVIGPKIFIGNLKKQISQQQIYELFSLYGTIKHAFIHIINKRKHSYAFVTYQKASEAMLAIEKLHSTLQFGRKINVRFPKKKIEERGQVCCKCKCHSAHASEVVNSPMKKKKPSINFGQITRLTFKRSRPSLDHQYESSVKASNTLEETTEESISHPNESSSSHSDSSNPTSFTFQPKPFQEFTLKDDEGDYFE